MTATKPADILAPPENRSGMWHADRGHIIHGQECCVLMKADNVVCRADPEDYERLLSLAKMMNEYEAQKGKGA